MTRRLHGAVLLVGTLTACAEESAVRVDAARLLVPDDVHIHWDESFNGERDGLGALVPVDVMAYAAGSGEPLHAVEVELEASDDATWVLLDEDFRVVEPGVCADCPFLWDARRDQYLALEAELAEATAWLPDPEQLDLRRISLDTDVDGMARAYLFVDAFPPGRRAAFTAVSVRVSLGGVEESFELIPR